MLSDNSDDADLRLGISNNNFKPSSREFTPTTRPFRRQQTNTARFPNLQKMSSQYSVSNNLGRQSSMTPSTFDKMYKCQYDLEAIDERLNQINIDF